jgi:hypothetical protein
MNKKRRNEKGRDEKGFLQHKGGKEENEDVCGERCPGGLSWTM